MRICVFGAGAVGGFLAARLAASGQSVSVVVRGRALAAIQARGLILYKGDSETRVSVSAASDPASLGPQDVVLVTVKSPALPAVVTSLAPLVGPETIVVFGQNGMPWWYPIELAADRPRPPELPLFKLADAFLKFLTPRQVLGGIVRTGNVLLEPGIVRNESSRNIVAVARIDDQVDRRVESLRQAFVAAGIASPAPDKDIRDAVWSKLVSNLSTGPLCVLAGTTLGETANDPGLNAIWGRLEDEGSAIAAAHGYRLDPAGRDRGTPHHKPSMLQDYERGSPLEIDAIVAAPLAFARATKLSVPTLETIAALVTCKARTKGLF